jgi:hypothetical protein|tara:strand:- start:20 stop:415 length:396 start_codon:yes stop_codon:yes gene_type:complete
VSLEADVLWLLATCLAIPDDTVVVDVCNVIERNNYYDDNGKKIFTQIVFWNFDRVSTRFVVLAWRYDEGQIRIEPRNGKTRITWLDDDTMRCVIGGKFNETWTQYDPEVFDRQFTPEANRPGLGKRKGWKR